MLSHQLGSAKLAVSTLCAATFSNDECGANGLPLTPNSIRILGRFQKLKTLSHDHLCRYLDLQRDSHERIIVVSEHYNDSLESTDRSSCLADNFDSLCRMTYQLLTALHYLNQENVVHRNLSPACILLDKQGNVKLSEYGLYYMTNCGRAVLFPIGVPNYMPAEALLQGIPVKCRDDDEEVIIGSGPKVDVWSLGIILLEKILGKSMFNGLTLQQKLFKIVSFTHVDGSALELLLKEYDVNKRVEEVRSDLRDLIEACLMPAAKRPTPAELLHSPLFSKWSTVTHAGRHSNAFTGLRLFVRHHLIKWENPDTSAVDDSTVDLDPLSGQDIDLVYYWWRLAGGDLRTVLAKAGQLHTRPAITRLANYVPLEGEMCGEAKDQSTLLAHRMTLLSLDQLRLRLQHLKISDYYPLLDDEYSKLTNGAVDTDDRHDAAKLPLVIKERSVEYQFRRTILFCRLLLAYPHQQQRIKLEARTDIPPFFRAEVWAALLDIRGDVTGEYDAIDKETAIAADRQLEVDVPRCHQYDELLSSPDGHVKLKRVLKAWLATHSQYVYWQGLDSLAAPFVHLNFNNEAIAFSCISAFIDKYLHNFFLKDNTPIIQEYLAVFSHLICFHDPELSNHLENIGFVPDLYAIPWFLTMFAHVFPLHKLFHLWDSLLLGNSAFPLFIGVAVLNQLRPQLLQYGFNECILQFSDMPDIDMSRCVQDSIRMFQSTPRSVTFRQHSPPVRPSNGHHVTHTNATEHKTSMFSDPISLPELRVERCPRISVDDLIDLCHLDTAPNVLQHKVNVLVIDVRTTDDYRKGAVPDSVNIPHQTAFDANGALVPSFVLPLVSMPSNRHKVKVILGGRGLYAVQFANGLVNLGVSRVCVLHRGVESLRGTSMLVVPSQV